MADETNDERRDTPARRRPRGRRVRRLIAGGAMLVIVVCAAAFAFLQTSWFRDELRGLIAHQAARFLNGRLVVGGVSGNLFSGIQLHDVSLVLDGQPAIVIPRVTVRYRLASIISAGRVIDEVDVDQPVIDLRETAQGWNLAHLMKPRPPSRPGTGPRYGIRHIVIHGGVLTVTPRAAGGRIAWPRRLTDLTATVSIGAVPGRVTFDLQQVSMHAADPALDPVGIAGRITLEPRRIALGKLRMRLADSRFRLDGTIPRHDGDTPFGLRVAADPVDLPSLAHLVPALAHVPLSPTVALAATGPLGALDLNLDFRSRAGRITAHLLADARGPVRTAKGDVRLTRVDLAPLIKHPGVRSDITATVHLAARQSAGDVSATYAMTAPAVTVVGYRTASMTARGRVDRHGVTVNASGLAYGGRVTTSGMLTWPLRQGHRRVTFDLKGRTYGVDLSRLPAHLGVRKLTSSLNFNYGLTGEWPRLSATFALHASTALGAAIADGGTGRFSLAGPELEYAASGRVSNLDLQRIGQAFDLRALSEARFRTSLAGQFRLHVVGTHLGSMVLDADGRLAASRAFDGRVGTGTLAAHMARGRLAVTANGSFDRLDLVQILHDPGWRARLGGTVDGTVVFDDLTAPVTVDNVSWRGRATFVHSNVLGLTVDRASVDGQYARRVAVVQQLALEGPVLDGQASGTLDLGTSGASRLSFTARRLNLARVGEFMGRPLSGQGTATGQVTGNARLLTVTASLTGDPAGFARFQVQHLEARGQATIAALRFETLAASADVTARGATAAGHAVAETATARLRYTDRTIQFTTALTASAAKLDADGSWHVGQTRSTVRLRRFDFHSGALRWTLAAGTHPEIVAEAGQVTVSDLRVAWKNHELTAAGTLGAAGRELTVHLRNFDLPELDTLLPTAPHVTGTADVQLALTGRVTAPHVAARLTVSHAAYRSIRDAALTGTASYDEGRIGVALRLEQPGGTWLTVAGGLPATLLAGSLAGPSGPAGALDLTVKSSPIGLALVEGFTTAVTDVSGTFQADLRVTGTPEAPLAHGHIDLRDGAMMIAAADVKYTGLQGRIELLGDRVHVDRLTVLDPHRHTLQVSGDLAIPAGRIQGIRADVRADRFEVIDNRLARAVISSDVRLDGNLLHPQLTGTVTIDTGKLDADQLLSLVSRGPTEAVPIIPAGPLAQEGPPAPKPSAFAGLTMNLTLHVPDNFTVNGKDLTQTGSPIGVSSVNLLLGGTVRLLKNPGESIRLAGTMSTVSGAWGFQGRRFDIQRGGEIQFQGLQPIDPGLNLTARRLISGVQTQVHVQGTLRQPRLALTSTPPLDQADILALIVFNQPLNQLGEQQQTSLVSRASAIAAGALTSSLAQSIGRALDLDLLEVQPAPSVGTTAALTIGQQIGSRLFLKVKQTIGRESATQFTIDYLLTDFMRLQTSIAQGSLVTNPTLVSQTQHGGIDLIFFFSY